MSIDKLDKSDTLRTIGEHLSFPSWISSIPKESFADETCANEPFNAVKRDASSA
jgi:hypothetical protein